MNYTDNTEPQQEQNCLGQVPPSVDDRRNLIGSFWLKMHRMMNIKYRLELTERHIVRAPCPPGVRAELVGVIDPVPSEMIRSPACHSTT